MVKVTKVIYLMQENRKLQLVIYRCLKSHIKKADFNHESPGYDMDNKPRLVVSNLINLVSMVKNDFVDSEPVNHGSYGYELNNNPTKVVSNPMHSQSTPYPW